MRFTALLFLCFLGSRLYAKSVSSPSVSAYSPAVACAGDTILIEGDQLHLITAVHLAGLEAIIIDQSPSMLKVLAPASPVAAAGSVQVFVGSEASAADGQISIKAEVLLSLASDASAVCEGEQVGLLALGLPGTLYQFFADGTPVSALSTINRWSGASLLPGTRQLSVVGTYNGCTTSSEVAVEVKPLPDVRITWPAQSVHTDAVDSIMLVGSPEGGVFSGDAVLKNVFYPPLGGIAGSPYTIQYEYTSQNGCASSAGMQLEIIDNRNAITGLASSYCADAEPSLVATFPDNYPHLRLLRIENQTAPGKGIAKKSGGQYALVPSKLAPGTYKIIAYYTNTLTNRVETRVQKIEIYATPDASFTGIDDQSHVCKDPNQLSVFLTMQSPNGVFSNDAILVSDNSAILFLDDIAEGENELSYTYTSEEGCSATSTIQFTASTIIAPQLAGVNDTYCYTSMPIELTLDQNNVSFVTPDVEAVDDYTYNWAMHQTVDRRLRELDPFYSDSPDIDSVYFGEVEIALQYNYTDQNGCYGESEKSVKVYSLPNLYLNISWNGLTCHNSGTQVVIAFALDQTEAGNGVFQGPGLSGNEPNNEFLQGNTVYDSIFFRPDIANNIIGADSIGEGQIYHELIYTYTDTKGCKNTVSGTMMVNQLSDINMLPFDRQICINAEPFQVGISNQVDEFAPPAYELSTMYGNVLIKTDGLFGSPPFIEVNPAQLRSSMNESLYGEDFNLRLKTTYTDINYCTSYRYDTLTFTKISEITLQKFPTTYCYGDYEVEVSALPSTGTFFGDGITNLGNGKATLNIATMADSVGVVPPVANLLEYKVIDENGCESAAQQSIFINPLPRIALEKIDPLFCTNGNFGNGVPLDAALSADVKFGRFYGAGVNNLGIVNGRGRGAFYPNAVTFIPGDSLENTFIYYEAETNEGCKSYDSISTTLAPPPQPFFSMDKISFCEDDDPVALVGSPEPKPNTEDCSRGQDCVNTYGTFSGTGVIEDANNPEDGKAIFNPKRALDDATQADPSIYRVVAAITYRYIDENGCEGLSPVQFVTVNRNPEVRLEGIPAQGMELCFNDTLRTLSGNLKMEGTHAFTGAGVTNLGDGLASYSARKAFTQLGLDSLNSSRIDQLTYTFTDANGCSASLSRNISLSPIPNISEFSDLSLCYGDSVNFKPKPNITSDGGRAQASYYTGLGITETQPGLATFSSKMAFAELASAKTVRVGYRYTNSNGCSNTKNIAVTVNPLPLPSFTGLSADKQYCYNDEIIALRGTEGAGAQGRFSGPGIQQFTNTVVYFHPNIAYDSIKGAPEASKTAVLSYQYTDANKCTNTYFDTVVIDPIPVVAFVASSNCVADSVAFSDATKVQQIELNTWLWDFGDGTSANQPTISHKYDRGGEYDVSLRVGTTKGCFQQAMRTINLGGSPRAGFSYASTCFGDTVQFMAFSQGPLPERPSVWEWSFSDPNGRSFNPNKEMAQHIFSTPGQYRVQLKVATDLGCTDSIVRPVNIVPSIKISGETPYFESFEQNAGGWLSGGENVSWEWAKPSLTHTINKAPDGERVWTTQAGGTYNVNEASYVEGPCFDMSALTRPMLSLQVWSEADSTKDGAILEYSTNDGATWNALGDLASLYNWYNAGVRNKIGNGVAGQPAWTGRYGDWRVSRHGLDMLKGATNVRFRMAFGSDAAADVLDGFAFDQVWIGERSHRVLIEHFTNTATQASANANAQLNALIAQQGNDVLAIQYHTATAVGQAPDPFNVRNPADPSARALFYGIAGTPSTIINGYAQQQVSVNALNKRLLGQPDLLGKAPFDLKISFPETPEEQFNVKVAVKSNIHAEGELMVQIALLERNITEVKGENGETFFDWTLRKLMPDAAGYRFNRVWEAGEEETIQTSWAPFDMFKTDPSNLVVLAFIQKNQAGEGGKEVLQTEFAVPSAFPPLITGVEHPIAQGAVLYPNPAQAKAYLLFGEKASQPLQWRIYNTLGQTLHSGEVMRGDQGIALETADLPNGLYFVEVADAAATLLFKKLMIAK